MTYKKRYTHTISWLTRFVELQLFLSLIALPCLIAWGLPFSLMSIIGNLIFAPVLMLFLTLSSLIFFSELLTISNGWLVYALELVTLLWRQVLSWQSTRWLIGFAQFPAPFLCLITLITLFIISRRSWYPRTRIGAFIVLFTTIWCLSYMFSYKAPYITYVPCNTGSVIILHYNKKTVVVDPGYIGQRSSACSWVQYTLTPTLIHTTGSLVIDYLIVLQPSSRIFEALATLNTKVRINNLYIPWWQGTLPPRAWHHFFALQESLQHTQTPLKRYDAWPITLRLSNTATVRIIPLSNTIVYHDARYVDTRVEWCIDKETIAFYAAKHKGIIESKEEVDNEKSIINSGS